MILVCVCVSGWLVTVLLCLFFVGCCGCGFMLFDVVCVVLVVCLVVCCFCFSCVMRSVGGTLLVMVCAM